MPAGRPTKYRPELAEQIVEWFEEQVKAKELPFLSRWAREEAGVCEDTAIEWTKAVEEDGTTLKHPEFSEAYKKAKDIQKEFLIKGGLTGLFNSTFAIFTAKNITDMRDQTMIDHTSKGEQIKGFNYIAPNDANHKANPETTSSLASPKG